MAICVRRRTKISFKGRNTSMGAYTQYKIFTVDGKEIEPHYTESSRSGRHWTDYWFLNNGKYYVVWRDISNSGKHYCGFGLLIVENGEYRIEKIETVPKFLLEYLCECIKPLFQD